MDQITDAAFEDLAPNVFWIVPFAGRNIQTSFIDPSASRFWLN
jgi:hypothetical protein